MKKEAKLRSNSIRERCSNTGHFDKLHFGFTNKMEEDLLEFSDFCANVGVPLESKLFTAFSG